MTVAALAAAIRRGELSPREAVQAALDRIEREDGAFNSFLTVRGEEALAEADALGAPSGPLHGVPLGGEGRDRRRGHADDRRLEGARRQRRDGRRHRRRAAAPGGRDRRRQAQHARVRLRRLDDERRVRPGAQPVGHRADLRRLERWERGGRRRGARPRRARNRHGRLDPDSRRVLRRHGHPAHDRPRAEPRRRSPSRGRTTPSDRSRARPRTARSSSTRSPAPTPTTPRRPPSTAEPCLDGIERGVEGLRIGVVSHLVRRGAARPARRGGGRDRARRARAASAPTSSGSTRASSAAPRSSSSS